MQEDKNTLAPLPFLLELFCSVKTRVVLKNSLCRRERPWEESVWYKMGSSEKIQHSVYLFMLKGKGTFKGVMTWFSAWYLGKEKEAQGGFSGWQVIQGPSPFQEALQGLILMRTCGTFWAWAEETKYLIFLLPSALPWSSVPVLLRGQQKQEGPMTGRYCEQEQEFSASCQ